MYRKCWFKTLQAFKKYSSGTQSLLHKIATVAFLNISYIIGGRIHHGRPGGDGQPCCKRLAHLTQGFCIKLMFLFDSSPQCLSTDLDPTLPANNVLNLIAGFANSKIVELNYLWITGYTVQAGYISELCIWGFVHDYLFHMKHIKHVKIGMYTVEWRLYKIF